MLTTTPISPRALAGYLDMLLYYKAQSCVTEPGTEAAFFDNLPTAVSHLARVAGAVAIPFPARFTRTETRTVVALLYRLRGCDYGIEAKAVHAGDRFKCCARDCAVLLCSMLRHKGVPARTRCGFARYIEPGMYAEHWVCEYWHDWEQRWVLIDPWLLGWSLWHEHVAFSPLDVPRTQFYPAGRAWEMCRIWDADPQRFGLAPGVCGLPYIACQLVRDLASLNRVEMLPWDAWGVGERAFRLMAEDDLLLLDAVAAGGLAGNAGFGEVLSLYGGHAQLRVPLSEYGLADSGVAVGRVA